MDATDEVMGGPGAGDRVRAGVFACAKPKTEYVALGIGLVFKSLAGGVVEICRVRCMRQ